MSRLDDYRTALLVASPGISGDELGALLDAAGPQFPQFIIAHGLGPLWHERTGREAFHSSRMQAEALFAMQEKALADIDATFTGAGIDYVVLKGAANRLPLYDNPAVRACFDIDLLVRPEDRLKAATALVDAGFEALPKTNNISIELLLTRGKIDVDLHWRLLRDGRLRNEDINGMLERRCNVEGHWMLNADDALFLLLVHPAFAKHLSSWELGLHRVADILRWLQTQQADWKTVRARLEDNDVRTAAWATLRWLQLLTHPNTPSLAISMLEDLEPGNIRRRWLNRWLVHDLSERAAGLHKARLLGFSLTLHDNFKGAWRALAGRYRAHRRRHADVAAFGELPGQ